MDCIGTLSTQSASDACGLCSAASEGGGGLSHSGTSGYFAATKTVTLNGGSA